MAPIDIVVLAIIGIAFVAVCVRIYRKGTCADCAQGGACTGRYQIKPRHPSASRASVRGALCAFEGEHGESKSIFGVSLTGLLIGNLSITE